MGTAALLLQTWLLQAVGKTRVEELGIEVIGADQPAIHSGCGFLPGDIF
jgi:hypothetical protein